MTLGDDVCTVHLDTDIEAIAATGRAMCGVAFIGARNWIQHSSNILGWRISEKRIDIK